MWRTACKVRGDEWSFAASEDAAHAAEAPSDRFADANIGRKDARKV